MTHERPTLWRALPGWAAVAVAVIGWFVLPPPFDRLSLLMTAFAAICVWAWFTQLADDERRCSAELERVTQLLQVEMAREGRTGADLRRGLGDTSGV